MFPWTAFYLSNIPHLARLLPGVLADSGGGSGSGPFWLLPKVERDLRGLVPADVKLVRWHVTAEDEVHAGQLLAEFERAAQLR